ncbi:MAG: nucleotidyltransferase [Acidithiobacillus sp.]
MSKSQQPTQLRRLLTVESARIMAEEGVADFRLAKEKAARRLGAGGSTQQNWPNNAEIEAELQARLQLFSGPAHAADLRQLREQALTAMLWLADFQPRLSGPVWTGTATRHSVITLHLFADAPETVLFFMMDHKVPYEEAWQRLHFGDAPAQDYPSLKIRYADADFRLIIFGLDEDRRSPASAVDGKPAKRANLAQLRKLLEETRLDKV